MKIRSWTGDEVEARVGMRCGVDKSLTPVCIERFTDDGNIWCSFFITGSKREMVYTPSQLTMLHCPFRVGDEVEIRLRNPIVTGVTGGTWKRIELTSREEVEYGNNQIGDFEVRHANPALRDSPEYKEESK